MCYRIFAGLIAGMMCTVAQSASFTPLGDLPGGATFSKASAISADGLVIVGDSIVKHDNWRAFRWTAAGGMVGLGTLPKPWSIAGSSSADDVSGDGSVIIGGSDGFPVGGSFRWTQASGMVPLTAEQGSNNVEAISNDGAVIVGDNISTGIAFRWTSSDGFVELGDLPGGPVRSQANGVSADGSVVVGGSTVSDRFIFEAFRWTAADGMVGLGDIPSMGIGSIANAVSDDGSVVVGAGNLTLGAREAFRWTAATGMVGLGDLPGGGFDSEALAVSADGAVIVGTGHNWDSTGNNTADAFIWTQGGGMQRLFDVLVAQGVGELDGWKLLDATGVSADGTAIVGMAEDSNRVRSAYLAHIAIVPIPVAAWFIAPAIGLLTPWIRRRQATG